MSEISDENACYVSIKNEEYFRLLASKVVLDVLNKSMRFLRESQSKSDHDSTIDLNAVEFSLGNEVFSKKSDAWSIDFSNDLNVKNSQSNDFSNISNKNLSCTNFMKTKKYLNKKRWYRY